MKKIITILLALLLVPFVNAQIAIRSFETNPNQVSPGELIQLRGEGIVVCKIFKNEISDKHMKILIRPKGYYSIGGFYHSVCLNCDKIIDNLT